MKNLVIPIVRHPSFEFQEGIPRYWLGGDPVRTHYLNALSASFPVYEQFFITAINRARPLISETKLQRSARAFCKQEIQHAKAHYRFNQAYFIKYGYPSVEKIDKCVAGIFARIQALLPNSWLLAMSSGMEHMNAHFSSEFLKRPEIWSSASNNTMDTLLRWHAAEEIEHKAVSFDVFMNVDGRHWLKRLGLLMSSPPSFFLFLTLQFSLLYSDGLLFKPKILYQFLCLNFGAKSLLRTAWMAHLQYCRKAFHPWNVDDSHLISYGLASRAGNL